VTIEYVPSVFYASSEFAGSKPRVDTASGRSLASSLVPQHDDVSPNLSVVHGYSNSSVSSSEKTSKPKYTSWTTTGSAGLKKYSGPGDLHELGSVPANDFGVTKDVALAVALAEMLKLAASGVAVVTYSNVKLSVGVQLHLEEALLETSAWRLELTL